MNSAKIFFAFPLQVLFRESEAYKLPETLTYLIRNEKRETTELVERFYTTRIQLDY